MGSRIYAGGNRLTAISNIKSDIAAMFTTYNGFKVPDTWKIAAYLSTQFQSIATDDAPFSNGATPATVAAAARGVDYSGWAQALNAVIGISAIGSRADFPQASAVTPSAVVTAVIAARAKTEKAASELAAMYAWIQSDTLLDLVRNYYQETGIDAQIPAGETRFLETRTWRYVYRTDKGELSKPSDASTLITTDQNDSVQLTPVAPPSGRFIDTILWYRSNNSSNSVSFQFVDEKAVASGLVFTDTKKNEELVESLPSIEWDEPPADLRGLKLHPNNFGVAFTGNTICPSVQNRLYAWPINWRKTTRKPIVGIAVSEQTIFAGTQGEPYLISGADPAFLSSENVRGGQPCRSARSIVVTSKGFMYAGADGVALCTGLTDTPVLTRQHFTKEQWEALKPESIFAVEHDGCYIFAWNNGVTAGVYSFGIETGRLATLDLTASALFKNSSNGRLYAVSGTQIVEVFGGATRRVGTWRSPRVAARGGFSWLRAKSDFEAGNLTVRWYRYTEDGGVNLATYSASNRKPMRTHSAPASMDEYEIEVEGQSSVTELVLADSSEGLKQ